MSLRLPVKKKLRFEIFKRDGFTCQYCGAHPPGSVLELDHIVPVALGGTNDPENLITSCFDCNRGKGAAPLEDRPETLPERTARLREMEDQRAAYHAVIREREERVEGEVWEVIAVLFSSTSTTHARFESVRKFLDRMDLAEALEAARIARAKQPYSEPQRFRYFCGVCWRKIEAGQ